MIGSEYSEVSKKQDGSFEIPAQGGDVVSLSVACEWPIYRIQF